MHALYETDILLSVYNELLVNMIYLLPGSCVVTVSYNLMSSPFLNSIAEQSQLFYIEISNFSVPVPISCKDKHSNVRFGLYSKPCKEELMKQDVYLQPGMLMSYLRVAKTYTMIHKYYDESEGSYVLCHVYSTKTDTHIFTLSSLSIHIFEIWVIQCLLAVNTLFRIIGQ